MRFKKQGNGLGLTVNISVDGNSCGFYVKQSELELYNKLLKEDEDFDEKQGDDNDFTKFQDDEDMKEKEKTLRLKRGIKLTKTKMIKAYCQLIKKPNLFITLSFKTERLTTEKLSNDERWLCMHNFVRNINYMLPDSWFFPIVGYTKNQGLHFHIPAYIDYEDWCDFNYLEHFCLTKWQDQLFRCDNCDCLDIRYFEEQKFSYLSNKKKNREYLALRRRDENCRLYTRLYKRNMSLYKTQRYQLSVEELEELQVEIEMYFAVQGIKTDSISEQFEYWSGRVSFIPHKWLTKTIKNIIKKREYFIKHTLMPEETK